MLRHHILRDRVVAAEQRPHVFRIHRLAQGGGAGHVREEDGDNPSLVSHPDASA